MANLNLDICTDVPGGLLEFKILVILFYVNLNSDICTDVPGSLLEFKLLVIFFLFYE